jgi:hypothetical protein
VTEHLPKDIEIYRINKQGNYTSPGNLLKSFWEKNNNVGFSLSCTVKGETVAPEYHHKDIKISKFESSLSRNLAKLIISAEETLNVDDV